MEIYKLAGEVGMSCKAVVEYLGSTPCPAIRYSHSPGNAIYLSDKTSNFLTVDLPNKFSIFYGNVQAQFLEYSS